MVMVEILVGINMVLGLPDLISIKASSKAHKQILNYQGIPYNCAQCHSYEYLGGGGDTLIGS